MSALRDPRLALPVFFCRMATNLSACTSVRRICKNVHVDRSEMAACVSVKKLDQARAACRHAGG